LVVIRLHDPCHASDFTLPELEREVRAAVDSWLSPCTAFRVELAPSSRCKGLAGEDGENAVVTRSRSWCPDAATHQRQCHDPRLEARTVARGEYHGLARRYLMPPRFFVATATPARG